jgi:hypothetical protein
VAAGRLVIANGNGGVLCFGSPTDKPAK